MWRLVGSGLFDEPFGKLVGIAWPLAFADSHGMMIPQWPMLKRVVWKTKLTHYQISAPLDKQVKTVRDSSLGGPLECLVKRNGRRNCFRERWT
jgi:hypothetical protein